MEDHMLDANRRMWDERVPVHVGSSFYDVQGFIEGGTQLYPFETEEVGAVRGRSLLHLQCHIGLDTLSWAREGAEVTGIDFSRPAIEAARDIARRCDLAARFEVGEVHEAPEMLGTRYDVVYTGRGALCWLPDIERWAGVVSRLVEPGGLLYLSEFHPVTDIFSDRELVVENAYFDDGVPFVDQSGDTYTDGAMEMRNTVDYTWTHPVGSVVNALVRRGFVLEHLAEQDYTAFKRFNSLQHDPADRTYRFPEGHPRLPLMYSLRMRMPRV